MKNIFIVLSIFIFTGIGFCEEADFPVYTGYVNDYADILSGETKDKITALSGRSRLRLPASSLF
jgi:uncharacterized membrane protein YgcG